MDSATLVVVPLSAQLTGRRSTDNGNFTKPNKQKYRSTKLYENKAAVVVAIVVVVVVVAWNPDKLEMNGIVPIEAVSALTMGNYHHKKLLVVLQSKIANDNGFSKSK